ncbi:hypothetical protein LFL97_21280 [Burkholderia sp. JSH-S8]|nr:hypothetical protein LFL97_21280 [Burkholderia sp. JSH-S8]
MNLSFAVDIDALSEKYPDASLALTIHERVLSEWRGHGTLIHPCKDLMKSPLIRAIDNLPMGLKKRWQEALKRNKRRACLVDWDGSFPQNSADEMMHLIGQFQIALLESTRACVAGGVGEDDCSRIANELKGMELCKFHSVSNSSSFSAARILSEAPLEKGQNCKDEWKRRYTSWIRLSSWAVLVDRYAMSNHLSRNRRMEVSGLDRFLRDAIARPIAESVRIRIFVARQPEHTNADVDEFCESIRSHYVGGAVKELHIHILKDREFGDIAHHRSLRLDYMIFGFDKGIDSFGGEFSSQNYVLWRKDLAAHRTFESEEAMLKACSNDSRQLL